MQYICTSNNYSEIRKIPTRNPNNRNDKSSDVLTDKDMEKSYYNEVNENTSVEYTQSRDMNAKKEHLKCGAGGGFHGP